MRLPQNKTFCRRNACRDTRVAMADVSLWQTCRRGGRVAVADGSPWHTCRRGHSVARMRDPDVQVGR